MKKYYCPVCKEFKGRFRVEAIMVGYETYDNYCKYCHNPVIPTEFLMQELFKKVFTDEDFRLKCCTECRGTGYK